MMMVNKPSNVNFGEKINNNSDTVSQFKAVNWFKQTKNTFKQSKCEVNDGVTIALASLYICICLCEYMI